MSAVESIANVAVGYGVAVSVQAIIFPMFGIHVGASDHAMIGAVFTFVSLARSYVMRRAFNTINTWSMSK